MKLLGIVQTLVKFTIKILLELNLLKNNVESLHLIKFYVKLYFTFLLYFVVILNR